MAAQPTAARSGPFGSRQLIGGTSRHRRRRRLVSN